MVLPPVRVEHEDLEGWLKKRLQSSDQVAIESTTNAWHVYDLLEPLAGKEKTAPNALRLELFFPFLINF